MNKRLFISSGAAVNDTDPFGDGSVKSFYRFDNNMNDDSGNGYNGTAEAGTSFSTSAKVGTHSIINLGDASNRQITLPNYLQANETITFWIYLVNLSGNDFYYIWEKHDSSYNFWNFAMYNVDGVTSVQAQIRQTTSNYRYTNSNISFAQNTWNFISYRYSSAGTHHFSLNGGTEVQLTSSLASGGAPTTPLNATTAVGQTYSNGSAYTGSRFYLDHYRAFNRVLTQAEITQLYNEV
jgi:hypothetical protein